MDVTICDVCKKYIKDFCRFDTKTKKLQCQINKNPVELYGVCSENCPELFYLKKAPSPLQQRVRIN